MPSASSRTARHRLGIAVCCLALLSVAGLAAGTGPAAPTDPHQPAGTTPHGGEQFCEHDDPGLAPAADSREVTFVDSLVADSLAQWRGGSIVRVGAAGDCSLAVTQGRTASLTAATVDGTRGVVTGTLDLGSNGSLRLVATDGDGPATAGTADGNNPATAGTASARTATTEPDDAVTTTGGERTGTDATETASTVAQTAGNGTPTTGLVIANDGPDYGTTAVVRSGDRSTRVALPSGRFFRFEVQLREDGAVRVAVWDAARPWDGEWDARFENATVRDAWQVRLHGRAFLDAIAVGVAETPTSPGASGPDEGRGQPGDGPGPDDDPGPDGDDGYPGPYPGTDFSGYDRDPGSGDSDAGTIFLGLLLLCGGALGYRFAYGFTKISEQFDAIGSTTRASEVEPAGWNVLITKFVSAVGAVIGLGMVIAALL